MTNILLPRIELLQEKKLIGRRVIMTFTENKTTELWRNFMPNRKEIVNSISNDLYSVEVYNNPEFCKDFDPSIQFEKWAAVEVDSLENIPCEMESLLLPSGLYAVFIHRGPASAAIKTYQYIFGEWLPNSKYVLDNRPHFALMGEKYRNEDVNSEEEIWIPIKNK